MYLWVFLFANHFRLRTRRTGDKRCLKTWELHQLYTLIIVGDGTHLKRRPRHGTLDFYTKVQVWGRMVRVSPQVPYTPKAILVKRNKNDVNSALLKKESQKKRDKKGNI
jgi:hypothetical protein